GSWWGSICHPVVVRQAAHGSPAGGCRARRLQRVSPWAAAAAACVQDSRDGRAAVRVDFLRARPPVCVVPDLGAYHPGGETTRQSWPSEAAGIRRPSRRPRRGGAQASLQERGGTLAVAACPTPAGIAPGAAA